MHQIRPEQSISVHLRVVVTVYSADTQQQNTITITRPHRHRQPRRETPAARGKGKERSWQQVKAQGAGLRCWWLAAGGWWLPVAWAVAYSSSSDMTTMRRPPSAAPIVLETISSCGTKKRNAPQNDGSDHHRCAPKQYCNVLFLPSRAVAPLPSAATSSASKQPPCWRCYYHPPQTNRMPS